jgi:peptidoglycan/LPS O-acetylase OafA/YrhL
VGTFRVILAFCVVVAHASPLPGLRTLDAGLAVKTFFMISGFYMAFILAEKYPRTREGRSLFYSNRLLRIYPMYFVTLVFAVLFYAAASVRLGHPADRLQLWAQAWGRGSGGGLVAVALSQLSVLGLDMTPLFGYSPSGGFHLLSASGPADATLAWRFNFLPHCWSIGAELLFYAMAPWLVLLRPAPLAALGAAGIGTLLWLGTIPSPLAAAAAYHLGVLQVPYFLLGILSHSALRSWPLLRPTLTSAAIPIIALAVLTFSGWPKFGAVSGYAYLVCAWLATPILFHISRRTSWDRWIGELSYPIYLLHVPVKWILLAARGVEKKDAAEVSGGLLVAATLVASALMVVLIDRPLERFRRERFERRAAGAVTR